MAYLSKIPINPLRREAQRTFASPQRVHAAVLGAMPPNVTGRVLWRDEVSRPVGGPSRCELLVLTPREPDWSHLVESLGWLTPEGQPLVRDLNLLLDMIAVGRSFGFRVRANPVSVTRKLDGPTASQTRKLTSESGSRSVRVAHRTAEHQLAWFISRAGPGCSDWGFAVEGDAPFHHVSVVARDHISFTKGSPERHRVTLNRATYEGRLRVTDADRMREVVLGGIGKGKAYGCGLLTLAPGDGHVVAR